MSDRDLKCVHCYEDQSNYGNWVDAKFMFDGLSLCAEHYHQHRDLVISPNPEYSPVTKFRHESYLGPEINNPSTVTIISNTIDTIDIDASSINDPKKTITIPYRDGYEIPHHEGFVPTDD